MRKLLARHLMRRLWKLALAQGNDTRYGSIGTRYNIVCLIPTILGGHSGWEPNDIKQEFSAITERNRIARHSAFANRWANPVSLDGIERAILDRDKGDHHD